MEVQKIEIPMYKLTLTSKEMAMLWELCYSVTHQREPKHAHYFYSKLEDARPGGGFEQEKAVT